MIYGVVNLRREATLSLVVGNSSGQREFINTVIDTEFDGFLSLPSEIIVRLGLPWTISKPQSTSGITIRDRDWHFKQYSGKWSSDGKSIEV